MHVDETPARAVGGLRYVHLACTGFLTLMHTGDRTAEAIDAGVLPGYRGVLVRDGYQGYYHLADAAHAWCAAQLLRDLKGLHDGRRARRPGMGREDGLPAAVWARDAAATARRAGQAALSPAFLDELAARYQAIAREGLAINTFRHNGTARQARAIARRFLRYHDDILHFTTR